MNWECLKTTPVSYSDRSYKTNFHMKVAKGFFDVFCKMNSGLSLGKSMDINLIMSGDNLFINNLYPSDAKLI